VTYGTDGRDLPLRGFVRRTSYASRLRPGVISQSLGSPRSRCLKSDVLGAAGAQEAGASGDNCVPRLEPGNEEANLKKGANLTRCSFRWYSSGDGEREG